MTTNKHYFHGGGVGIYDGFEEWNDRLGYRVAIRPTMTSQGLYSAIIVDTVEQARAYLRGEGA